MKPRPEFVVGGGRWQHSPQIVEHGEKRADPLRRETRAEHGEGGEARTSRLVALVAGTFDGRQRASTPARWLAPQLPSAGEALRVWHAATDARNRSTVRRVYSEALPRPLIPAAAARSHARAFEAAASGKGGDAVAVACQVLALLDDLDALGEYAAALTAIAPEYADGLGQLLHAAHYLRRESHPRYLRGTERVDMVHQSRRIARPHALAYAAARAALTFAQNHGKNAADAAARRGRQERQEAAAEARATPTDYAHGKPPPRGTLAYARWHTLNPDEPDRPLAHSGRCGRSRTATTTGKSPRYLSRLITDPERRLFARMSRGTRALVVVDMSGSMSLTTDDLEKIMSASVGATVVGYAADDDTKPNCHLLAHRGRRVREIRRYSGGNGVDAPALVWACRRFARSTTPVLWITDCQAVGRDGQNYEVLDDCRKVAKHYGVRIEESVEDALAALDDLRRGRARPSNPDRFAEVIRAKQYRAARL